MSWRHWSCCLTRWYTLPLDEEGFARASHQPGHDISLLTSRFRDAQFNDAYERSRARVDGIVYVGSQQLFAWFAVLITMLDIWRSGRARFDDAGYAATTVTVVLFAVLEEAALLAYMAGLARRRVLELGIGAHTLVRCCHRALYALPNNRAYEEGWALAGVRAFDLSAAITFDLATAVFVVAMYARYELALPVATAVSALLFTEAALGGAWTDGAPRAADWSSGRPLSIVWCTLALLAGSLYLETIKRSAWVKGWVLSQLRKEISHFGLNHLYHATSAIEQTIDNVEAAPATAWVARPLGAVQQMLDQITTLLKLIVDDWSGEAEELAADIDLLDFAALVFRGVDHAVGTRAQDVRANLPSWVARSIIVDCLALARHESRTGRVRAHVDVDAACEVLVVRVQGETRGLPAGDLRRFFAAGAGGGGGGLADAERRAARVGARLFVSQDAACEWLSAELSMPITLVRRAPQRHDAPGADLDALPAARKRPAVERRSMGAAAHAGGAVGAGSEQLHRPIGAAGPDVHAALRAAAATSGSRQSASEPTTARHSSAHASSVRSSVSLSVAWRLRLAAAVAPGAAGEAGARGCSRCGVQPAFRHEPSPQQSASCSGSARGLAERGRLARAESGGGSAIPFGPADEQRQLAQAAPARGSAVLPLLSAHWQPAGCCAGSGGSAEPAATPDGASSAGASPLGRHAPSATPRPCRSSLASSAGSMHGGGARPAPPAPAPSRLGHGQPRRSPRTTAEATPAPFGGGGCGSGGSGGEKQMRHTGSLLDVLAPGLGSGSVVPFDGLLPSEPPLPPPPLPTPALPLQPAGGYQHAAASAAASADAGGAADAAGGAGRERASLDAPDATVATSPADSSTPSSPPAPPAGEGRALLPMPPRCYGREAAASVRPARPSDSEKRILVVLDNNLDSPLWSAGAKGALIAQRLKFEMGLDCTVVMHTGASAAELANLIREGAADEVTIKDRAGRDHVCNLVAQHDVALFVDDMQMILASIDAAIGKHVYGKVRSAAHVGGWAATANTHVRFGMFCAERDLETLYAICRRELALENNACFWEPRERAVHAGGGGDGCAPAQRPPEI